MKRFKIDNFLRTHPNDSFPWFEELESNQVIEVRVSLAKRLGLSNWINNGSFRKFPFASLNVCPDVDAERDDFDLRSLIDRLHIESLSVVFVYYIGEGIERMQLDQMSHYWSDIWYPGSDDVMIFDETFSWLILVNHEGQVSWMKSADDTI